MTGRAAANKVHEMEQSEAEIPGAAQTNPSVGTFAFLFTDIEGSTRLWEEQPQAMETALRRHDALLGETIAAYQGKVFKRVGDACYAVFPVANEAVAAALAAQRRLLAQEWPVTGGLRVRMAVHAGSATQRDNDYFGPCLNMAGRLVSTGHGAQILVSDLTAQLVQELPAQASLRDLGLHRLKDIAQPQRIFQLIHPDLNEGFAPLRTLAPALHNPPLQLSSFIGREKELEDLHRKRRSSRLVTVVGMGGSGKTRLAIRAGLQAAAEYPEGVYFVNLAPLTDGALLPQVVAAALGILEDPRAPLMQTLIGSLKPRRTLLLWDNCEHLVEDAARLCETLLQACPDVTVIATSREPLGIPGEVTCAVPPLAIAAAKKQSSEAWLRDVAQGDATRLFIERAQAAAPSFALSAGNADTIARVCRRLDGLPLAIELASALVRVLPLEQIDARLDDRFRLLTGGSRTALPRQKTLRAALDWSYDLLTEPERILLRRVSVFQAGWTLEAAEAVCAGGDIEPWQVLDLLGRLVDKSLTQFDERGTRYDLLETLREYGREHLANSGGREPIQENHARFFLGYAERLSQGLHGPRQAENLDLLSIEHDNLRVALDWWAARAGGALDGLRLGAWLWPFWAGRGHLAEGRQRLSSFLARDGGASPERADALFAAAELARLQGDHRAAWAQFDASLALRQEIGHEKGVAWAMMGLGMVARDQGDHTRARTCLEQSLSRHRSLGEARGQAAALNALGILAWRRGDYPEAFVLYQDALARRRALGDKRAISETLNNLGIWAHVRNDLSGAQSYYHESLALQQELGDRRSTADTLHNLGILAPARGAREEARSLQEESLSISRDVGDRRAAASALNSLADIALEQEDWAGADALYRECLLLYREVALAHGVPYALGGLARIAAKQERWERAACVLAASEMLRAVLESPLAAGDQEHLDTLRAQGRAALGNAAFEAYWSEGAAWSPDEAAEYALGS